MKLELDEEIVFREVDVKTNQEVIQFLSEKLYENGYVTEEYISAIQERELEYPTGLPSSKPGIAIPHANFEMVKKTTLAIATLKNPVDFQSMDNHSIQLPVQIVIMMAIGEPHGQVEMLQKVVNIIQDEPLRKQMVAAKTDQELLKLLETAVA